MELGGGARLAGAYTARMVPGLPPATRRDFIAASARTGVAFAIAPGSLLAQPSVTRPADPWRQVDDILARIVAPTFPDRDVDITRHGAIGDGVTDCTAAIGAAIDACYAIGGGRVVVPPGRFLTGAIHLRSRVNLHVREGATLAFSTDPRAYLPLVFTRWEGIELMNYSPFIYAWEQRDIAITGRGTLDGQASATNWWSWKARGTAAQPSDTNRTGFVAAGGQKRLSELAAARVPVAERVFGDGDHLRPNFIQPYRCDNVLIEGVRIINSPMWEIHPVLCRNVIVRGVDIASHGPNNDGCDPESCRDVLIEHCTFDTGDDCIALKSGRNDDGRRVNVPVENVVIRDCRMKDGHGGVVIGSEISGSARNVFAERCQMDSPHLDRALRIKTNAMRGGIVEHIYMRDVTVGQVAEAVVAINFYYEEADKGPHLPIVRDVEVRNVTSRSSRHALLLRGFAQAPIEDVRVVDCRFDNVAEADVLQHVTNLQLTNMVRNGVRVDAARGR